ncbi:MAG: twin-arginine translocase subunit TatC [Propionicimonas sp.]
MARPRLAWLRPPKAAPGGVMSLADHLRELRYRLIVAIVAIALFAVLAAVFYDQLYLVMMHPWQQALDMLKVSHPGIDTTTVISDVTGPLMLAIKVCAMAGLVLSSPIWVYQIWAFIVPALLAKEKKWALAFIGAAVPLFLLGVAVGYYIMPQGIVVMLSFTPDAVPVLNLLDIGPFMELMLRLMVVFGLGFLMPVVVVGLNLVGVVKARQLAKVRSYVIFGIFVFAAAATPSSDPFSMLALAIPMTVLYLIAEVIARVHDRRATARQAEEVATG